MSMINICDVMNKLNIDTVIIILLISLSSWDTMWCVLIRLTSHHYDPSQNNHVEMIEMMILTDVNE